jgi:hypothetical protein
MYSTDTTYELCIRSLAAAPLATEAAGLAAARQTAPCHLRLHYPLQPEPER